MDENELWRARIAEERANELQEYKMTATMQIESQIERVSATLERQKQANQEHREHIKQLDAKIAELQSILKTLPEIDD